MVDGDGGRTNSRREMASNFATVSGKGTKLLGFAEEILNPTLCFIKFSVIGMLNHSVVLKGSPPSYQLIGRRSSLFSLDAT